MTSRFFLYLLCVLYDGNTHHRHISRTRFQLPFPDICLSMLVSNSPISPHKTHTFCSFCPWSHVSQAFLGPCILNTHLQLKGRLCGCSDVRVRGWDSEWAPERWVVTWWWQVYCSLQGGPSSGHFPLKENRKSGPLHPVGTPCFVGQVQQSSPPWLLPTLTPTPKIKCYLQAAGLSFRRHLALT